MIGDEELAYGLAFVDPDADDPLGVYRAMDHNPPNTHHAIFRAGQRGVERLSLVKKQMLVLVEQLNYVKSVLTRWQVDRLDCEEDEHSLEAHEIHVEAYRLAEYLESYLRDKSIYDKPSFDGLDSMHPVAIQKAAFATLKKYDRFAARYPEEFDQIGDDVACILTGMRLALRMELNTVLH